MPHTLAKLEQQGEAPIEFVQNWQRAGSMRSFLDSPNTLQCWRCIKVLQATKDVADYTITPIRLADEE